MKAVVIQESGGPEGLQVVDLPDPVPAGGQVLITPEAIGVGGDRIALWSHPAEVVTAVREGGWSAEAIAEIFPSVFAPRLQEFRPEPLEAPKKDSGAGK